MLGGGGEAERCFHEVRFQTSIRVKIVCGPPRTPLGKLSAYSLQSKVRSFGQWAAANLRCAKCHCRSVRYFKL